MASSSLGAYIPEEAWLSIKGRVKKVLRKRSGYVEVRGRKCHRFLRRKMISFFTLMKRTYGTDSYLYSGLWDYQKPGLKEKPSEYPSQYLQSQRKTLDPENHCSRSRKWTGLCKDEPCHPYLDRSILDCPSASLDLFKWMKVARFKSVSKARAFSLILIHHLGDIWAQFLGCVNGPRGPCQFRNPLRPFIAQVISQKRIFALKWGWKHGKLKERATESVSLWNPYLYRSLLRGPQGLPSSSIKCAEPPGRTLSHLAAHGFFESGAQFALTPKEKWAHGNASCLKGHWLWWKHRKQTPLARAYLSFPMELWDFGVSGIKLQQEFFLSEPVLGLSKCCFKGRAKESGESRRKTRVDKLLSLFFHKLSTQNCVCRT